MRLWERHRPVSLDQIVGQPPVKFLQAFVREPHSKCFLLEGPPGTGKTTAAMALAHDVGCEDEEIGGGLMVRNAADLRADAVRSLFARLNTRPLIGGPWKVLVIEELEALPSVEVQRLLKTYLDVGGLPYKTIVVATSNDASGLSEALLERFTLYFFQCGTHFAGRAQEMLAKLWDSETGNAPMPHGWMRWGYVGERFSMRRALDQMQDQLAFAKMLVC